MYSITQIKDITGGKFILQHNPAASIEHLLTDSRKILFPSSTLFFALPGPRRSGNSFISDLYNAGVVNFIVQQNVDVAEYANTNIILVDDVVEALQKIAAFHRRQFTCPVIGITGSNGKTIVKEWLYQLLHNDFSIVRNPKSYNSQIGVPLSVWQMNSSHTLGIFEAGISLPGEMDKLEKIIQPQIALFTNIGAAHSEGFNSNTHKIYEKSKLFEKVQLAVYSADDFDIAAAMEKLPCKKITWGKSSNATLHITSVQKQASYNAVIKAVFEGRNISIAVPFTDNAYLENAISCWCVMLYFGIGDTTIAERMHQLKPVEMRLELKLGINNCSVINDSYSADINSLIIALDFLQQQQQHPKRTVILSDILQTGKSGDELYTELAEILQQKNINRMVGIGPGMMKHKEKFTNLSSAVFFNSTDEFKQRFYSLHFNNETILVKGARLFEFEQINRLLEQKQHQTVVEINLNAVAHNLKQYQLQLSPGVKMMVMVKAAGYGSGSYEIANLMQFNKVDYLAVAYADEGVELRKAGITLPVMVMNVEKSTFDLLVQHNLEPELFSLGILTAFENYLLQNGIQYFPVHIKIDTGMKRLGFETEDIPELCKQLSVSSSFKVQSVFSHLAASDAAEHDAFTAQQVKIFEESCVMLRQALPYNFLRHIANTSAIHRHKNLQYDMVRLGIGLYGVDAVATMQQQLKNVTTLKTTIAQIKNIKAGESVGYSRAGMAKKDTTIATVRIGYADGYPRNLSNGKGSMLVNGMKAPVIGNVCMDMTMLDVTGCNAQEGDEVVVFGEKLSVNEMAMQAGTIAYEILTGISQRVQRVYYEE